ncbi:MAG: hypothetical protein PHC85_01685, partial [Candidatus Pacebacteria bacterium]|nr:hypothetical protein [Candidatus Paceibacterota bacterium]
AENSPKEVLSATGDGVDIYKMVSYAWAGIKAQQEKIDKMELRMGELEGIILNSGSNNIEDREENDSISSWLSGRILNVKKLFVEEEICIGNTCVNEQRLRELLDKNGITPGTPDDNIEKILPSLPADGEEFLEEPAEEPREEIETLPAEEPAAEQPETPAAPETSPAETPAVEQPETPETPATEIPPAENPPTEFVPNETAGETAQ